MNAYRKLMVIGLEAAILVILSNNEREQVLAKAPAADVSSMSKSMKETPHPGVMDNTEQMKKKMSPEMMIRCKMMMGMSVNAEDPAALLAVKERLHLTQDQVDRLEKIAEQARLDATKVLTDEQAKQLQLLDNTPQTMKQMHQTMMEKMQSSKDQGKTTSMQCPMMQMMREMEKSHPGTQQ